MGPVADVVESVVDVVGDVAEFVVDNALPIIETVALSYALGPAGFGLTGTDLLVAKAVGNAAISAINGGSLGSIAAAGLTPFISSPDFTKNVLGVNLSPTSFIAEGVNKVISDPQLASIVTGAVGSATTAGVIAGITGGDILQAASMAGLSNVVSTAVAKTWQSVQQNLPKMTATDEQYKAKYEQVKDVIPKIDQANALAEQTNSFAEDFNKRLEAYNQAKALYDDVYELYDVAKAANDVATANKYAAQINDTIIPDLNSVTSEANSFYDNYQSKMAEYQNFMNENQASFDTATPIFLEMNTLQNQYELMNNEILADYAKFQMTEAIKNQDFTSVVDYQNQLKDINKKMLELDPNAQVRPTLTDEQAKLMEDIKNASSQTEKYALTQQIKADPTINKIVNAPLLKDIQNATTNLVKQGIVSNIMGNITGSNNPPTRPTGNMPNMPPLHVDVKTLMPAKKKPPTKVDVTKLTPITDPNFKPPTQATTLTAPATEAMPATTQALIPPVTQDQPTTPQAGGLEMATTAPTNTTQTINSGLQSATSTQDTSPPTKVDVSKLTPVTDTNLIKNLGLNIG
jgi:hypothetical protein